MRFLVVDDDETLRLGVKTTLETRSYQVDEACDGAEAVEMVKAATEQSKPYQAVLLDVNMPKMSGIEALGAIRDISPSTFCIVLTAYSNVKDAVAAIKYGAYDYLEKPVDGDRIFALIDAALEANEMVEAISHSAPTVAFEEGRKIIGNSSSIQRVFDIVHKLSKVDTSVLIRGESGTGKELVARAIHFNSHRKKGPFLAVNCAAIPENLIESELFGHEKGAFTGADRKKIGKFQFAEGGTIFLDEIGDISSQMQVKLLRVLQEKCFTPVGSNSEVRIDLRIVAATNKPLEQMIEKETFRADLFYRLNVLPINLPPLRDRREDIPRLVEFMIKRFNRLHSRDIKGIDKNALSALRVYSWPGNIRELENVIEHAFIVEAGPVLTLGSLPDSMQKRANRPTREDEEEGTEPLPSNDDKTLFADMGELNYPALKEKFEKEFLIRALRAFDGRVNQTAEHTQMTKVTLLRKLEKYGINPREFGRH